VTQTQSSAKRKNSPDSSSVSSTEVDFEETSRFIQEVSQKITGADSEAAEGKSTPSAKTQEEQIIEKLRTRETQGKFLIDFFS